MQKEIWLVEKNASSQTSIHMMTTQNLTLFANDSIGQFSHSRKKKKTEFFATLVTHRLVNNSTTKNMWNIQNYFNTLESRATTESESDNTRNHSDSAPF